ncbi:hypothetical protein RvY_16894 [Ramazzottius varieornatus]|uniref:Uncharacterized protein n=1 Tax=Ramazzottius varieornatus TaxID=947166 RepID=A0A1D1W6C1_RAMVA|nr:hypothetical protein RvY_16894 [Ramazzottius varieornatus]
MENVSVQKTNSIRGLDPLQLQDISGVRTEQNTAAELQEEDLRIRIPASYSKILELTGNQLLKN